MPDESSLGKQGRSMRRGIVVSMMDFVYHCRHGCHVVLNFAPFGHCCGGISGGIIRDMDLSSGSLLEKLGRNGGRGVSASKATK